MPDSVENILLELDHTFMEHSIKNSVKTSNGDIVRLDRAIWTSSSVLLKHSEEGTSYLVLCAPTRTVSDLLTAHRNGTVPAAFPSCLNLLAVARQLMLKEVLTLCFNALFRIKNFTAIDYPSECSSEVVMHCFSVFLDSPLRTADIYKQQLGRIAKHCEGDQGAMTNAMNLVKQKLQEYNNSPAAGIPVGFERRAVPVVIYRRGEEFRSAIIDKDRVVPLDLFGKNFNLGVGLVDDFFYLKYSSYVLYKSGRSVYCKNLRDDSDPVEKLGNCHHILTRGNFVFAMEIRGEAHSILQWVNDGEFVEIYKSDSIIKMVDFEFKNRWLAIGLQDYSFQLFKLKNAALTLLQEKSCAAVIGKMLGRQKMPVILMRWCFEAYEAHRDFSLSASEGISEHLDKKRLKFLRRMKFIGGSCFLHEDVGDLKLVGQHLDSYETKTLFPKRECCAVSELSLEPFWGA